MMNGDIEIQYYWSQIGIQFKMMPLPKYFSLNKYSGTITQTVLRQKWEWFFVKLYFYFLQQVYHQLNIWSKSHVELLQYKKKIVANILLDFSCDDDYQAKKVFDL